MVVLTYTKEDGSQEQVEFKDTVTVMDLQGKGIKTIDLTPLSSCTNLRGLWLHYNQLQTIDLSKVGEDRVYKCDYCGTMGKASPWL